MTSRLKRSATRFLLLGVLALVLDMAVPAQRLSLNTATVEQLEALPGLGKSRARMVVRVREKNGAFRAIDELLALPRLTRKQFEELKKHLYVGFEIPRMKVDSREEPR